MNNRLARVLKINSLKFNYVYNNQSISARFIPLQLMASGCTTITNHGPTVEWLLRHKYNCILTSLTHSSILESFQEVMNNYELRRDIFKGGLETVRVISWDPGV